MVDFRKLQKDVYQNKVDKGFNTTDVNKEFCLTYAELAEAYDAWLKKKDDVGEELADVVIFTMGLSEILGVDLESEIINKINKNSKRVYKTVDGVLMKVKSE
ncbi:mazG nucleotide pyrophosphohydrolase domain protein [Clostridium sp. CAG:433]|jgi:NTP pyrophosphatase (non-canonical NTP hydrolase)|nr:mazG nucleotide pyrophosphohydrolase domain protein [Clostridium sp. CAG:433]